MYTFFFRANKIFDLKITEPIAQYLIESGNVLTKEIAEFDHKQIDYDMIVMRILKGDKSFDFSHQNASIMSTEDLEEILRKFFVNSHADIDVPDSYIKEENIVEAKKYVQMLLAANIKSHRNYENIRETYQQFIDKFSYSSTIDSPSASQLPSLLGKRKW